MFVIFSSRTKVNIVDIFPVACVSLSSSGLVYAFCANIPTCGSWILGLSFAVWLTYCCVVLPFVCVARLLTDPEPIDSSTACDSLTLGYCCKTGSWINIILLFKLRRRPCPSLASVSSLLFCCCFPLEAEKASERKEMNGQLSCQINSDPGEEDEANWRIIAFPPRLMEKKKRQTKKILQVLNFDQFQLPFLYPFLEMREIN